MLEVNRDDCVGLLLRYLPNFLCPKQICLPLSALEVFPVTQKKSLTLEEFFYIHFCPVRN